MPLSGDAELLAMFDGSTRVCVGRGLVSFVAMAGGFGLQDAWKLDLLVTEPGLVNPLARPACCSLVGQDKRNS